MSNNPEKKASIKVNYIYNLVYDVLALIVPLITTPYISRVLEPESIGVYSYTYSIIMYFTAFVALGTKSYVIKRISRAESKKQASVDFWCVFALRAIAGFLALTVYYLYVFTKAESKTVSLIQSIYIVAVVFDISWFFQGMENFKTIIFRNLILKILSVIVIFTFVRDNGDFFIYVISLSGLTLAGNLTLWGYLPKYLTKIKFCDIKPFTGIKEIMILFIPTLALQIYSAIDRTMLGAITNEMAENAYYEQSNKIINAALTAITALSIVGLPRISALYAKKEYVKVSESMQGSYRFVFFLSLPMAAGLCAVSDVLVPWFLGNTYNSCIPILCVMSVLFVFIGLSNITGLQYLVATDRQTVYSISIVSGTVINILLNWFLINRFLSLGAAAASVISEAIVLIIQLSYIIYKKEFTFREVFGKAWRYLLGSIIMFCIISGIKQILPVGFTGLFASVVIGAIIYMVSLIIMKDDMIIKFITHQIIHRFIRKKKS